MLHITEVLKSSNNSLFIATGFEEGIRFSITPIYNGGHVNPQGILGVFRFSALLYL